MIVVVDILRLIYWLVLLGSMVQTSPDKCERLMCAPLEPSSVCTDYFDSTNTVQLYGYIYIVQPKCVQGCSFTLCRASKTGEEIIKEFLNDIGKTKVFYVSF